MNAYAQIPFDFAKSIPLKTEIEVDLWLIYCFTEPSIGDEKSYGFTNNCFSINGQVTKIYAEDYIRVDCGIDVDVDNETNISPNINVGSFVEASGTIRVYFPNSEYEFGELT